MSEPVVSSALSYFFSNALQQSHHATLHHGRSHRSIRQPQKTNVHALTGKQRCKQQMFVLAISLPNLPFGTVAIHCQFMLPLRNAQQHLDSRTTLPLHRTKHRTQRKGYSRMNTRHEEGIDFALQAQMLSFGKSKLLHECRIFLLSDKDSER